MTKNELIYKFIDECVFDDVLWDMYNLESSHGAYIATRYWLKIRDMFALSKDEVNKHINEYIETKVKVPPLFNVQLERCIEDDIYTTTRTTAAPENIIA